MKSATVPAAIAHGLVLLASALSAAADAPAARPPLPGIDPARIREIFLVQHTHTDLGFTAPQPEILRDHLRFIDEAVRMVRETDGFPEEARFKWTCEVTYGVEAWLRARPPETVAAFLDAVRRGRIEVAGLPASLTDLASEEVVIRSMNNYWFTNFPAIQPGEFRFRYSILPFAGGPGSDSEASRFARELALPLRAAVLPPGKGTAPAMESLLRIEPANVSVAALKAADDGRGAILRIAEDDGKEARAVLSTPLRVERAERATFLEEPLGGLEVRAGGDGRSEIVVPVPPRGTVTVRLAPFGWR